MNDDMKMFQEFMRNIVRQIAYLDLETMKAINKDAQESRSKFDAIGPILDPTRYRDSLHDGTLEHAEAQEEIAKHLIAIRELIDKLERAHQQYRNYHE